jgi:hypothetical protein
MVFGDWEKLGLNFVSFSLETLEQCVHGLSIPGKLFGNGFSSKPSFKDSPVIVNGDKRKFEFLMRPIKFGNVVVKFGQYFKFHGGWSENFGLQHEKQVRGLEVTRWLRWQHQRVSEINFLNL